MAASTVKSGSVHGRSTLYKKDLPQAGELSDEDVFGAGPELSDDDVFDAPFDDRDENEKGAGWALNILDTITPSWGDEIVAGAMSVLPARGNYDQEVAQARSIQKRYAENEPWDSKSNLSSSAIGLVGGLAPASKLFTGFRAAPAALKGTVGALAAGRGAQAIPAAIKAAKATTRLGRAGEVAAGLGGVGATYAEVNQAGQAEGGADKRVEAIQAGGGAVPVFGAGLGLAAGVLGAGGSRIAQRGFQALRGVENKAARYIAEKLLQSGNTVDDLAATHAKAAETGKPVALADVGPQGVKDAAGATGRTPGPGREIAQGTVLPRQEGQVARVSGDVGEAVGGKPGSFTQTTDELTAQQQAKAKPLYQQAFADPKPVVSSKIVEITNRPSGKAAIQRGLKIAQDEGIPEAELVVRDAAGNITGYSTKALHYAKLALDDMIEAAQRSGDNSAARAYTIMKRELLGEIDRVNPAYAAARKAFAGPAANKNALEAGRKAVNSHPDQIKSEMAGMSEAEQEMYKRGFAQRIIEDVERSPDAGNAARRIFGNTAKRERLRAVLGDEEYSRLAERLGVEDAMYGTYKRTNVGSETAERIAGQSDIDDFLVGQTPAMAQGFVSSLMTGTVGPLVQRIGMGGIANLLRGISQRARGSIARMLFSSKPAEVKAALNAIAKEYKNAQAFQANQEAAIAQISANEKTRTGLPAAAVQGAGQAAEVAAAVSPF